jgi:hypothetical protein
MDNIENIDTKVHKESAQLLLSYYQGEELDPLKVKSAMSGYNGSTRAMSTARVAESMQLSVLREMANDKEELRKYIKATLPSYVPKD